MSPRKVLIELGGLPGVGKSTVAKLVAAALDAVVIEKDRYLPRGERSAKLQATAYERYEGEVELTLERAGVVVPNHYSALDRTGPLA